MTWEMTAIPPEGVPDFWPTVEPLLAPAVAQSGGRVTMPTLYDGLLAKRSLLWAAYPGDRVIRAAFVTRVAQYPARRMLSVDFAGGTGMREWVEMVQDTFRRFAIDAECDGVEMAGRTGWVRKLGHYGWKQAFMLMDVDVAEKRA